MSESDIAIRIEGLAKKYCKRLRWSALYTLTDAARGAFGLSSQSDRLRRAEFWALQDINLEVKRGECLGVIGPNGAGKTTLLSILGGMIEPDKGRVEVRGRVGALIQLGAGFHPQLTGRENVYVNGAILGMSRSEIKRKFDAIVEFADIGDFLDSPVKFYSSGMLVRLGFAIAVHTEPDVLLVDEVLAVGDIDFKAKCYERMEEIRRGKCAIVLVSHSMPAVGRIADTVCHLERGQPTYTGAPQDAISHYGKSQAQRKAAARQEEAPSGPYTVQDFSVYDQEGEHAPQVDAGDSVSLRVILRCNRLVQKAWANITITAPEGAVCSAFRTELLHFSSVKPGQTVWVQLSLDKLALMPGTYLVQFQLLGPKKVGYLTATETPLLLTVRGETDRAGMVYLPHAWKVSPELKCSVKDPE